jgi:hypothetical protein
VDAAAARVPGVTRVWDPVWDVPVGQIGALRAALDIERETCAMRVERWDPVLLERLGGDWSIGAYWAIPGGRVEATVYASGLVRLEGGSRFDDELQPLTRRSDPKAVAAALFAWRPEHFSWALAHGTPA